MFVLASSSFRPPDKLAEERQLLLDILTGDAVVAEYGDLTINVTHTFSQPTKVDVTLLALLGRPNTSTPTGQDPRAAPRLLLLNVGLGNKRVPALPGRPFVGTAPGLPAETMLLNQEIVEHPKAPTLSEFFEQ